ncbi:nucleoside hydrolase [Novipirellula artificiosorum]|uniref:Pyrimidine-specific ribonucleoside hydrolase RihA n=1 Tax=Novipirellula artificiosorum TaxID=2528016 RepID=A0A5C6D677_9BACT|nr:nucleoside hydrolase [Novipirellula artificiosorum]TWU31324.1 Pyrimidine-specific ribonucleoside hydrolase RihA [Novipirellula artificiosorum]
MPYGLMLLVWLGPQAEGAETIREQLTLPKGRIDVVLDSDMYNEVDDQFALAYALHSADRIDLKAVCAAPFKNHRSTSASDGMERSYNETLRVLEILQRSSDEFVFRGSKTFLPDRHTAVDSPAARRIIELAKQDRQGPLVVVGLGAATNIASALLIEPTISDRIMVVWIGGHPYDWDHARDFNLNQDIAAAQVLFGVGVPLVHVPAGDVAASLTISLPELEIGLKGKSPIADALYRNVEMYYQETAANKGQPRSGSNAWRKVIWDIATIAWLVDPENAVTSQIVTRPLLTDAGNWQQATHRYPVRVAVRLDRERIYTDLFAKLGRPYLPSPTIGGVEFDFRTHRRLAQGSDNWPTTWADDGNLYAVWGDGGGFDGTNSKGRVTLGVARIEGDADNYVGKNVWGGFEPEHAATFGGKSYGILSVDTTLAMWLVPQPGPHLSECRLAQSGDRGQTWQQADWAFRFDQGLSIPTFLNFGRNNAGARDEFLYSYFIEPQWGPKTPAESQYGFEVHKPGRIHLARVPKRQMMQRDRFEFFAGRDDKNQPTWTRSIGDKQAVFRDDNGVGWNVSVSFNAGLNRYLLATEHSATHDGKFGLFDAPQPWGPWTTVAYEDHWAEGHLEVSTFYWNFPTKWQSSDGRTFTMVFTGKNSNDSWNTVAGRFLRR